jgi:acylglycerol lipase
MTRLAAILCALMLGACTPLVVQQAGQPPLGFHGPRLERDSLVSFDGARLGLTRWDVPQAVNGGQAWAVIVALHGMNDYSNAFHFAAPWWAQQGIATYAYDQRGFGRSPQPGVWAGDELMEEDLRTATALVRQAHPGAKIVVVGESMGGAVAAEAFASDRPPAADLVVL